MNTITIRPFRYIALAMLAIAMPFQVCGQSTISGTVRDAQTKQPLPFAAVYLNFTTIGVYTNSEGKYMLKNISFGKHEVIASYPGYQSFRKQFENHDTATVVVDIQLNVIPLQEVSITASHDDKWERQLQRFHKLFFGNSPFTKQCRILNPWVLDFESTSQAFKATASAGLIVENLGLGYRLNYQLTKFEVRATDYTVSGIAWFQEFPSMDTALVTRWRERRAAAWFGSTRHLLVSMANGTLKKDGYVLYEDISKVRDVVRQPVFAANTNKSIVPFSLVGRVVDGNPPGEQFFLRLPPKLEVHYIKGKAVPTVYRDVAAPLSWLEITSGSIEINRYGIVMNPAAVTVSGVMGQLRMAEQLPYDYSPDASQRSQPVAVPSTPSNAMLERPYLQTDKSLYYADEALRFKAYMKYSSPAYRDTLSNVLIVDLIREGNELAIRRQFLIDSLGMTHGAFNLSKLRPGNYQLRAYTRWMLNFDPGPIFNKTIRVLSDAQRVAERKVDTVHVSSTLFELQTNTNAFRPGDSLQISMNPLDERGFPLSGDVSISISPLQYSSSGMDEPDIRRTWSLPVESVMKQPSGSPNHIQYGIDVSGRIGIKMKPKKLREAVAMLSQENSNDLIARYLEADGSFAFPPMNLYDTMKVGLQVIEKTGRKINKVFLDSIPIQQLNIPFHSLQVVLDTLSTSKRRSPEPSSTNEPATLLEEVTIVGTTQPRGRTSDAHFSPDLTISGDDLRKTDNGDIISLIQSRVPGLRVLMFDDGGIVRRYFKLGGIFTFDRNPANLEPIVLIDGYVLPAKSDETAAEQVARLSVSQIDRIEAVKFGGGAAYGARGANGVIAIYTNGKNQIAGGKEFIDRTKFDRLKFLGLSNNKPFQTPRFYEPSTTLYWNPFVKIKRDGSNTISIVLPDVKGSYSIIVEGVSSQGTPLKASKVISIR